MLAGEHLNKYALISRSIDGNMKDVQMHVIVCRPYKSNFEKKTV